MNVLFNYTLFSLSFDCFIWICIHDSQYCKWKKKTFFDKQRQNIFFWLNNKYIFKSINAFLLTNILITVLILSIGKWFVMLDCYSPMWMYPGYTLYNSMLALWQRAKSIVLQKQTPTQKRSITKIYVTTGCRHDAFAHFIKPMIKTLDGVPLTVAICVTISTHTETNSFLTIPNSDLKIKLI